MKIYQNNEKKNFLPTEDSFLVVVIVVFAGCTAEGWVILGTGDSDIWYFMANFWPRVISSGFEGTGAPIRLYGLTRCFVVTRRIT